MLLSSNVIPRNFRWEEDDIGRFCIWRVDVLGQFLMLQMCMEVDLEGEKEKPEREVQELRLLRVDWRDELQWGEFVWEKYMSRSSANSL